MRKIICNSCNGEDEFKHEECRRCKGTGLVANNNWISYCSYCNGKGSSRRHTCKTCKGKGKLDIEVEELVTVRPGTNEEDSIRLMGRGNQHLKKGFFGDVVMFIAVLKNTDKLKREGYNTFGEVKVSITEATLGSNVSYSTIWGDKTYKMKAGTQDGVTIRRHGEGYRKKSKGNGDHFLKISVVIPRKISNIETKIYRELQNIEHEVDDLD